MQLIVGISGASGVVYAVKLLKALNDFEVTTHLIITTAAAETIKIETDLSTKEVISLASYSYDIDDITSPVSSGSFKIDGMVVVPCSMKTLSGIASGYSSNLLLRAADVTLKERRPLVLVPRETPLSLIHLDNLCKVARAGGIILPAMPGFYHKPKSVDEVVNHVVGKILDVFNFKHDLYKRWEGR
jgi:4-hydroxy-3-polyprenylbenzoate decarboxylase